MLARGSFGLVPARRPKLLNFSPPRRTVRCHRTHIVRKGRFVMSPRRLLSAALALAIIVPVVLVATAMSASAYGGDGKMDVYQVGISFNCNNRDFCGGELGGFWGWAEFDRNPATGATSGDAEFAGCSHGEFNGAVHESIEITSWYTAPGSAGPETIYASGEETDRFRGQTETFSFSNEDTGVPAVEGHYSTEDVLGFSAPPGIAIQIQVAYKPAH
jgi:hypothetical protein